MGNQEFALSFSFATRLNEIASTVVAHIPQEIAPPLSPMESLAHFQGGSPYIYPMWLGELPQAFACLSAIYDDTYMLNKLNVRYLFCCSYAHNMAPKGKYIAFVTPEAETDQPEVELKPGVDLLGHLDEIFYETYDRFEPENNHEVGNCFISTSYDATTHFESTVQNMIDMYSWITGKELDLSVDLSAASAAAAEE